jgi:tripartite-type tricarboxylate transporter receptor subunit TctC
MRIAHGGQSTMKHVQDGGSHVTNFLGLMLTVVVAVMSVLAPSPGRAESAGEFYAGKTIELHVASSAGGGYDTHARLLARHMSRHLPGKPNIVVKNVEGAGGLRLANALYNLAPKDGSVFGIIYRSTPFEPLMGNKAAQFDATRFGWIGSASNEVSVCVSWHDSGVGTFADLGTKEMIVGATGPGSDSYSFTKILNGVLDTRMKLVSGYPGGNELTLAMERGETTGRCGWSWSSIQATRPNWIREKKVNVLVQLALRKHPDLPDVPLVIDLARTGEERDLLKLIFARQVIAYPYLAPPGIPADRLAALRDAFTATTRDAAFLADADKAKLEILPVSGDEVQALITEIFAAPAPLIRKAADLLK